jgi:outer membrane usher protein
MVYDLPQEQQRFVLGDFTAFSGELGSVLPMGGLSLSKLYSMSPELVRQPLASFAGVATSPSQVEVRVGGVPIAYSQVSAGPFELQNLRQYGGANDVQVVVRDALGREQVYGFPYYYADQSLRQGLHEYSYALGKLRVHPGQPGDDYRDTALSAFHRFGYSDQLTFGGRAEAAQDLSNLGLEAAWRSNQWGVLSAAVSAGNYRGQSGDAAMLSYSYRQPAFSFNSIARRYSEHYAPLETLVNGFHRSGEYGATFAWFPNAGNSFNLSHTLTQSRDQGDSRVTSLSGSHRLGPASLLYATLQRTDDAFGSSPNNSLFIGWLYRFGGKYTASASASGDEHGQQTLFTQLSKDIPYGEGLGYRVGWTGTKPQNDDRFNGYAQWNLPAVSLSVDMNTLPAQNGNADYRELAATGSIAYAGNAWGLTRQINDSFAVVQMGAPVSGVRVMSNSQEIGFSDSKGQVISPFLGSFYESSISVDEQTIPLQYVMGKSIYTVKPTYRSGVGVNFGLRSVHGLDGVIRLRTATGTATADNWLVTLTHDGNLEQDFQIGRDGRFYLENIAPGDYQGEIPTTPNACRFTLQVPVTQEIVFTLPGDLICEPIP